MILLDSWVDVGNLKVFSNRISIPDQAAEQAVQCGSNGNDFVFRFDHRNGLSFFNGISNMADIAQDPCRRTIDHPFFAITADDSGNAGIGCSFAPQQNPAKIMAPLSLHDRIHVLAGFKSGAQGNRDGRHGSVGSQIFLGQDRVHYRKRLQSGNRSAFRIYQHGQLSLCKQLFRIRNGVCQTAGHILHRLPSLVDRFRKSSIPANG